MLTYLKVIFLALTCLTVTPAKDLSAACNTSAPGRTSVGRSNSLLVKPFTFQTDVWSHLNGARTLCTQSLRTPRSTMCDSSVAPCDAHMGPAAGPNSTGDHKPSLLVLLAGSRAQQSFGVEMNRRPRQTQGPPQTHVVQGPWCPQRAPGWALSAALGAQPCMEQHHPAMRGAGP